MEPLSSDSQPPSDPPPVLPYRRPEQLEARWGMPLWGQIALGMTFFFVALAVVGVSLAGVGPLAVVIGIGLVLFAAYIHLEWKWRGFVMGIFLAIGASILLVGICAIVIRR